MDGSLLRIEGLADRLGVSVPTVRVWVRRGIIPVMRGDRILLFDLGEVLAALRANGEARVALAGAEGIGGMS
jgi:predicted site-specific integrase-resolvase